MKICKINGCENEVHARLFTSAKEAALAFNNAVVDSRPRNFS
jgi:hypothetical protein